ncbi:MAG: 50S ribosomal protein L11 methyltransferase [Vampirovibrio sp.]|nr:50S ribosomal protein L11 methyltransferase [Vampirovibrio sp.]
MAETADSTAIQPEKECTDSTTVYELMVDWPQGTSPSPVDWLSEWLWTVSGVESVSETWVGELGNQDIEAVKAISRDPAVLDQIQVLLSQGPFPGSEVCSIVSVITLQEDDWAEAWKKFWDITPITSRLTIRPTWLEYTAKSSDEVVLDLDPGCAFGTGAHATTRLMLQAIEKIADEQDFSNCSILDVGTGSGILSVYAAKKGCRNIMALDILPLAIQSARWNAEVNRVADRITVNDIPLHELCRTKYNLILANILGPVILSLLPEMCLRLEPGGVLLASGLIESSVGSVEAAMASAGFTALERNQDGEWFAVCGIWEGD